MDPALIAAITPIVLAVFGGIGWVVKFFAGRVVDAIDELKKENTKQHDENAAKLDKFTENLDGVKTTVNDTNTRVAVIEVDLTHVKRDVARNSEYIDVRRNALPPTMENPR